MRSPLPRLFAVATLVAYLLATTGVIGTHQHHHGINDQAVAHGANSSCQAEEHLHGHSHCNHSHCSHTHAHQHVSPAADETVADSASESESSHRHCPGCPSHGPGDDDNCAVCKLLSAKTLAPVQVIVAGLSEQVAELRLPAASSFSSAIQGLPLSRGPPARG